MFCGVVLCTLSTAAAAPLAHGAVAAPVTIPAIEAAGIENATSTPACVPAPGFTQANGSTPWHTCLLPDRNAVVDWPNRPDLGGPADPFYWPNLPASSELRSNGYRNNRSFVFNSPGKNAIWLGYQSVSVGYPLIWYDAGSGMPVAPASGGYEFPLAGKYWFECLTCLGNERLKLQGTVYVRGPRAIVGYSRISGSGDAVTYQLDASGSFVADYAGEPNQITEYSFDFNDDGAFEVTSPEPIAQHTFTPGGHTIRVRVKDNSPTPRYGEYPFFFEVPFIRAENPEPNPIADNSRDGQIRSGVKFDPAKIKLKAAARIKISVLRRKGLSVRVSGLTKGDRIRARLLKGKRTVVASGNGTTAKSTKTVRLRVGRTGRRVLSTRPRPKRLVVDVAIEGTDGYQLTRRVGVRIRP